MRWILLSFFLVSPLLGTWIEERPHLKPLLHVEPKSNFQLGMGISPLTMSDGKLIHGISLFQIHWTYSIADIELLSTAIGISSTAKTEYAGSRHFWIRTSPKFRPFPFLSIGPVAGYEFVLFKDVEVRQTNGTFTTPLEPFSSSGFFYGGMATQTFSLSSGYQVRVSEIIVKETYSITDPGNGWAFDYARPELAADPDKTPIKPNLLFMIEVSFLF